MQIIGPKLAPRSTWVEALPTVESHSGSGLCLCAVTVNAALTMQMLGPATSDPNVRENGIGIRTFSFLDVTYTGPVYDSSSIAGKFLRAAQDRAR